MSKDNLRNILGDNTNNNQYSSNNVSANADGSIIERIEYLQSLVSAFTSGEVLLKGVVDTAAPSTTNVKCDSLKGYGEDFFNNVFYMQVVRSGGAAPEPEVRKITNYVTATGTFTVDAFSDTVASGDLIYIMHESAVILGRDDADNVFASTNVVANADGSIIERIEYIQSLIDTEIAAILAAVDTEVAAIKTETDKIAATITTIDGEVVKTAAIQTDIGDPSTRTNFKSLEAMIGIVDAANSCLDDLIRTGFDSSAITNDEDGSIMERLEGLKDRLTTIAGYLDTEIASILEDTETTIPNQITALNNLSTTQVNAEVDAALNTIVPASPTAGSLNDILSKAAGGNTFNKATDSLEALSESIANIVGAASVGYNAILGKRVTRAKADVLDSIQNAIFDATGDVLITHIEGLIEDGAVDSETVNTKFIWNSTSYGDTDLCANADLNAAAVGTKIGITGTFTDALQKDANGVLSLQKGVTLKGGGTIDILSSADGGGDNAATASFVIWYLPLSNDGAIVAST